jgi:hypothetical protein
MMPRVLCSLDAWWVGVGVGLVVSGVHACLSICARAFVRAWVGVCGIVAVARFLC